MVCWSPSLGSVGRWHMMPVALLVLAACSSESGHNVSSDLIQETTVDRTTPNDLVNSDIIACPSGQTPFAGGCLPIVPTCQPGHLPTLDGGCVAVGPRACPKEYGYDTDDLDCLPGQPMPCRPGTQPSSDGVACVPHVSVCDALEVPVVGGGCHQVGPSWAAADPALLFADCPPGHLALTNGDCRQVGPRACPKLWDVDSGANCELDQLVDCPDGWIASLDGLYCTAEWSDCATGEVPSHGGGCKRLLPEANQCPEGPFPLPPADAGDVLYVDAGSNCEANCGTPEAPYPSLQQAVDEAQHGAHLLVAGGTYADPVIITTQISIIGLCAAKVALTGAAAIPDVFPTASDAAAIAVLAAADVSLSGISVSSPAAGIVTVDAPDMTLDAMEIANSTGPGVEAVGNTTLTMTDSWVHGSVQPAADGPPAAGLLATSGAAVELDGSLLELNAGGGIVTQNVGTSTFVEGCVLRTCGEMTGAGGMNVSGGALGAATNSLLEGNHGFGISLSGVGTTADISDSEVRGTVFASDSAPGLGLLAADGAALTLSRALLSHNQMHGLRIDGTGTTAQLDRTAIVNTQLDTEGKRGDAMQVVGGASVQMLGSLFQGNIYRGVTLWQEGTTAAAEFSLIRQTVPNPAGELGDGLAVGDGGKGSFSHCLIEDNTSHGVNAAGPGTHLTLNDTVVRWTKTQVGALGVGLSITDHARVEATDCLLDGNAEIGVLAMGEGCELTLSDSQIRDTLIPVSGHMGYGLVVDSGAAAILERLVVEASGAIGIFLSVDASAELTDSAVISTKDGQLLDSGVGVLVANAADCAITRSLFRDNGRIGIAGINDSFVRVSESAVLDIAPDYAKAALSPAGGMLFTSGSTFQVQDSVVGNVSYLGIGAAGEGATGTIDRVVLYSVTPVPGYLAFGIFAAEGGVVSATDCWVQGVHGAGAACGDPDSLLELDQCTLRQTLTGPLTSGELAGGHGITAYRGGHVSGRGLLLEHNSRISAMASETASLDLQGTIIAETAPNADGTDGHGLVVLVGGSAVLAHCLLTGNSTVGAAAYGDSSQLTLLNSMVTQTQGGGAELEAGPDGVEFQVFGDGVLAAGGASVTVSQAIMTDNQRTGLYFWDATGTIAGSLVSANRSFGLALHESVDEVDHVERGNVIIGNALDLPPAQAAEITAAPTGLPLPPPPIPDPE